MSPTGRTLIHYRLPRPDIGLHDIAVAPDGAVWYADMLNSCVGRLDPATGAVSEYSTAAAGDNPHGITVDSAGMVWYASPGHRRIGRIDPASGRSQRFDLPEGARDLHSLIVHGGRIWFTTGSLDPHTSEVTTNQTRYQLVTDSDGAAWIGLSPADPLIRFSVATLSLDRRLSTPDTPNPAGGGDLAELPVWWRLRANYSGVNLVTADRSGRIWYIDRQRSMIGMLDPNSVEGREFATANERAFVDDLAVGPDGLIWFYEVRVSSLVGLDPATGRFEFVPIGLPDARVTHMTADSRRGHVWLALADVDGGVLARLEQLR